MSTQVRTVVSDTSGTVAVPAASLLQRALGAPAGRVLLTLTLALAGGALQLAHAAPGGPGMMGDDAVHGPHGMGGMHGMRGMHGEGGPGMGMMGGRYLERMLDSVNASPEQRNQIQAIARAAKADLRAQADQRRSLHQQTQALFAQPTVDARAAEALRQQMQALNDQASKRNMQMMLDISRVLSPEQRTKLAERMNQRRALMERHRAEREALEAGKPGASR